MYVSCYNPVMSKHIFEQRVFYADTDSYGIVWHGSYLRWMEMGRVYWTEMQGMNLDSTLVPDQGSMKLVKDFDTAYLMTADRSRFLKSKWRDTYWTYCLVKYPSLNATTGATRTKH